VSIVLIALAQDLISYFWLNVVEGLASAASAPIGTMLLLETRHKRWWPSDIGLFGLISGIGTTAGLAVGFVWLFVIGIAQPIVSVMTALLVVAGILAILSGVMAWAWIEEPRVRLERRALADLINLHRGVVERLRHFRNRVLNVIDLTRSSPGGLPRREQLFLAALGVMTSGSTCSTGRSPSSVPERAVLGRGDIHCVSRSECCSDGLFFHSGKVVEWHSAKYVFIETLAGRVGLILLFLWGPMYVLFGLGSPALVAWITLLNALLGVTWAFISVASTLFLVRLVGRSSRGSALGLYNAVAGPAAWSERCWAAGCSRRMGSRWPTTAASVAVIAGALILVPIPYHVFVAARPAARRRGWRSARALSPGPPGERSKLPGPRP